MPTASLQTGVDGSASLSGTLDFSSVPELWPELSRLVSQNPRLELSLAGVNSANSAALALLLEALELARQGGGELLLRDLPQDLQDLAELSNVAEIVRA